MYSWGVVLVAYHGCRRPTGLGMQLLQEKLLLATSLQLVVACTAAGATSGSDGASLSDQGGGNDALASLVVLQPRIGMD